MTCACLASFVLFPNLANAHEVLPAAAAATVYGGPFGGLDWGRPVAIGDLDGDGYDDVIIGDSRSWGGVLSRVFVFRGGPGRHSQGFVDLTSTNADQVILGATLDDNLGASLATGDVNGDGYADLLMCASTASEGGVNGRGIAYVVFGGPTFFQSSVRDLSVVGNWDLRILGPVAGGDMGGSNLLGGLDSQAAAIGNLNGDAYGDIVLGVHLATGAAVEAGRVYVVFGAPYPSGFTLNLAVASNYGVRIDGRARSDELGTVVLTGDLTGDGIDELIIPTEWQSRGVFTSEGAVYIFRGRTTWPTFIGLASTPADITLFGARTYDQLGAAAAVGDFNGDGILDLAAAAPGAELGALTTQRGDGIIYGLFGSTAYQTGVHSMNYATASADFRLIGNSEQNLGTLLAVGDFNGDGTPDLAAAQRFAGGQTNGTIDIVFGHHLQPGAIFYAGVDTDLRILGGPQERIGFVLSAADLNADGVSELVFGSPFANSNRGKVAVLTYVHGDGNHDGAVDLLDFALMQVCATEALPAWGLPCALFDFDLDEAITASDLTGFDARLAGPVR